MIDKALTIRYDFSNKCNQTCDYCIAKKDVYYKTNIYEPTADDIDNMISNLSDYKIKDFLIYGGEPTINPNLEHLVNSIEETFNSKITLCTNGSKLDVLKRLKENPYSDKIYIWLSLHPKYYNQNWLDTYDYVKNNFDYNINVILDKRYENNLLDFSKRCDNFGKLKLSYVKNKENTISSKKNPFYKNEYSDLKFIINSSKMFKTSLDTIYERYYTPLIYYNKLCCNTYVVIKTTGEVYNDENICFPPSKIINVYKEKYVHEYKIIRCNTRMTSTFGLCTLSSHED